MAIVDWTVRHISETFGGFNQALTAHFAIWTENTVIVVFL